MLTPSSNTDCTWNPTRSASLPPGAAGRAVPDREATTRRGSPRVWRRSRCGGAGGVYSSSARCSSTRASSRRVERLPGGDQQPPDGHRGRPPRRRRRDRAPPLPGRGGGGLEMALRGGHRGSFGPPPGLLGPLPGPGGVIARHRPVSGKIVTAGSDLLCSRRRILARRVTHQMTLGLAHPVSVLNNRRRNHRWIGGTGTASRAGTTTKPADAWLLPSSHEAKPRCRPRDWPRQPRGSGWQGHVVFGGLMGGIVLQLRP